ncbi:MAG: tetratricopeptide repeat protein [Deltaproteobacteria bacterium]|nr:tetratricopeptide repeat protein [Deltaproteobacteria bacterium]
MKNISTPYLRLCHILLLTGLVWITFGNSLKYDFVWDDYDLIIHNKNIRQLSSVSEYFTQSFWNIDERARDKPRGFFRPLVMASYALDYRLYGLNPAGFHLTNVLGHLLCVFLVYALGARLLKNLTVAWIAAAVWAIHPTHVENVVWISGRGDILAGIFFFLACLFFLKWFDQPKRPWIFMTATAVCYALALLCKEMAITLPAIFLMAFCLSENRQLGFRHAKTMLGLLAVVTFGYLEVRYLILGSITGTSPLISTGDLLLNLPLVFTRYIGLVLGLIPIDPHHADTFCRTAWSVKFISTLMVVLVYGAVVVLAWFRRERRLFFCLLWFPVTLTPVFNLGGFGDILYADRFLYIPSVGLILAAVYFVHLFIKQRSRIMVGTAVGLFCLYLFVNIFYARTCSAYWKNNLSLFSRAVKTSPASPFIQFSFGKALSDVEAYEEARKAYGKAIALYPRYVEAYNNKAFVLNRLGRYGESLTCSRKVVSLGGVHYTTLINMGDSFMGFGDMDAAENFYTGSLAIQESAIGHHQLALYGMEKGQYDRAEKHFKAALSLKQNPRILNNLGTLFLQKGEPDETLHYSQAALAHLKPGVPSNIKLEIHYHIARAFFQKGALDQAERYLKKTCELLASGYGIPPARTKIMAWFNLHGFPCGKEKKSLQKPVESTDNRN